MRLKPHEAQSYRKKALWVSWISIVVTLILAVAGFSKFMVMLFLSVAGSLQDVQLVLVRSSFNHPQTTVCSLTVWYILHTKLETITFSVWQASV